MSAHGWAIGFRDACKPYAEDKMLTDGCGIALVCGMRQQQLLLVTVAALPRITRLDCSENKEGPTREARRR